MSYVLSDDHRQVQDLIRRVAKERVAPRANEIDRTAEYPADMFVLLQELGLFTLPFPEEHNGSGSMLSACIATEELARVCYATTNLLVAQWVAFGAILAGGTKEQRDSYLPGVASGGLRAAFSTTEPQSGSDVAGIKTKATPVSGGYRLSGSKIWCTNADVADFIIVAAKTPSHDSSASINLFIVEKDTSGFQVGRKEHKMGARGVPSCALFFDEAFVPESRRLGPEGKGFKIVMEAFNKSRPIIAARGVGLAQGALDHAIAFIQNRQAFNQKISDFQGVRWMVADMATHIEAARQLVYHAAALVDSGVSGQDLAPVASMAKCFATDVAMRVATDAVQLFGAAGISAEYPINRYFRDAKVLQILEGTNQIQRNIVSNNLLGRAPRH